MTLRSATASFTRATSDSGPVTVTVGFSALVLPSSYPSGIVPTGRTRTGTSTEVRSSRLIVMVSGIVSTTRMPRIPAISTWTRTSCWRSVSPSRLTNAENEPAPAAISSQRSSGAASRTSTACSWFATARPGSTLTASTVSGADRLSIRVGFSSSVTNTQSAPPSNSESSSNPGVLRIVRHDRSSASREISRASRSRSSGVLRRLTYETRRSAVAGAPAPSVEGSSYSSSKRR